MPHHVHAVTTAPPNPRLLFINTVGQTVISTLTIIGSSYLLYALMKQGRGKLRVRLLLGMILGDLLLGYVGVMSIVLLADEPDSAPLCQMCGIWRVGGL